MLTEIEITKLEILFSCLVMIEITVVNLKWFMKTCRIFFLEVVRNLD